MNDSVKAQNAEAAKSTVTMDDLTQGEIFPEVKENAIEAVQAATAEQEAVDPDAPYGRKPDGTPKKKRGRKAGGVKAKTDETKSFDFGESAAPPAGELAPGEIPKPDSTKAAVIASGLIEGFTVATISKAWTLEKAERERNIIAWRDAFDHYGGVALTPPLALVADHLLIIQKRALSDGDTKSRINLLKAWVRNKFRKRTDDPRTPEDKESM